MAEDYAIAAEAYRLLQGTELFVGLPQSARRRLASYAQERFFLSGELVLREGDPGEEFFLVASGSVHVIGRAFDGTNLIMTRLTHGQVFGEQALLQGGSRRRNASVRAAEGCRLLVFPREALLEAQGADQTVSVRMRAIGERQTAARGELLRDKLLQELGLGGGYQFQRFEKGEVVFREGDPPTNVYLILQGTARVRRGEGPDAQVLSKLLPGQFFGELAIMTNAPRSATVEATSPLQTAALDGAWFRAALAAQPKLQSLMASLQAIYLLPARGLVTLQTGTLGSEPTLSETLAPDIRMFRIRLLNGEAPPAIPGQHLIIQGRIGGRWIERPYTITSAPGARGTYEVIVKRERQGLLSRWLFDSLDEGTALRSSPPI